MSSVEAAGSEPKVYKKRAGLRMKLSTREALAAYLFLTPFFLFFLVFLF